MKEIYHLQLTASDVGRYAILAGDPARIPVIAEHFESAREVGGYRGFLCYNGFLDHVRVCAVATGIGCPSTAIVVEELITLGVRTFIRVGTCGSLQDDVKPGELVVSTASIRCEGTTRAYVPIEYPAVADVSVVSSLITAANQVGAGCRVGITHCKDAFYSEIPDRCAGLDDIRGQWATWRRANALVTEMEASALFVLAALRRCRAGALFAVVGSVETGDLISDVTGTVGAIKVAVAAMRSLIRDDQEEH